MISILEISGRKHVRAKPKKCWFAIKARFAIQVEGATTGLQRYEDRIAIVKSTSSEHAKNALQPEFKRYGRPYLNSDGFMVRWEFESVLDQYEILEEEIDPKGAEVFSEMRRRRMKPEYLWKPIPKEKTHANRPA